MGTLPRRARIRAPRPTGRSGGPRRRGAGSGIVVARPLKGAADQSRMSPDGRWVAYNSSESGRPEVYVVPFPPTGDRFQVSPHGGVQPIWRSDSRELFFLVQATRPAGHRVDRAVCGQQGRHAVPGARASACGEGARRAGHRELGGGSRTFLAPVGRRPATIVRATPQPGRFSTRASEPFSFRDPL